MVKPTSARTPTPRSLNLASNMGAEQSRLVSGHFGKKSPDSPCTFMHLHLPISVFCHNVAWWRAAQRTAHTWLVQIPAERGPYAVCADVDRAEVPGGYIARLETRVQNGSCSQNLSFNRAVRGRKHGDVLRCVSSPDLD
jgi:hypothetical protein